MKLFLKYLNNCTIFIIFYLEKLSYPIKIKLGFIIVHNKLKKKSYLINIIIYYYHSIYFIKSTSTINSSDVNKYVNKL